MKYPDLRTVKKGDQISQPAHEHGYVRRPAPSDGVVWETREDSHFIAAEALEAAGWYRRKGTP